MKKSLVILPFLLISSFINASDKQVQAYIKGINHPYFEVSQTVANDIYSIPIVGDSKLYIEIEKLIRKMLEDKVNNSGDRELLGRLGKALAASGNNSYIPLLEEIIKNSGEDIRGQNKEVRAVEKAISLIDRFSAWQSLIKPYDLDDRNIDSKLGQDFLAALKSTEQDPEVKIYILKNLFEYGYIDFPPLYEYLRDDVTKTIDALKRGSNIPELINWKAKALYAAGAEVDKKLFSSFLNVALQKSLHFNPRHIRDAQSEIERFSDANLSIAKAKVEYPELSRYAVRWVGLMSSDKPINQVWGIREAFDKHRFDEELLRVVMDDLKEVHKIKVKDRYSKNYQAWACKYLAASGNKEALSLLREVAENAATKYVKKHARKQLKIYKKMDLI